MLWISVLTLLGVLSTLVQGQNITTVRSAALVIMGTASSAGKSVTDVLTGYGIPFTTIVADVTNGLSAPITLVDPATQTGLYTSIIFPDGFIAYADANGAWGNYINGTTLAAIDDYARIYKARKVIMNVFPSPDYAATFVDACCGAGVESPLSFNATTLNAINSGVKTTATLSSLGLYHYRATITNSTQAVPLLFSGAANGANSVTALIHLAPTTGVRSMVFFIPFGDWSLTSTMLNHIWVSWAFRNLYAGHRRVLLSTQVDDVFLSTELWDPAIKNTSDNKVFRTTSSDLAMHATWTTNLNSRLPAGSAFKMELAYNFNGILEATNVLPVYTTQGEADAGYDYVRPSGQAGPSYWPTYPTNPNWPLATLRTDTMCSYSSQSTATNFFWVSHTMTHLSLNNVTYDDVFKEISYNQLGASRISLSGRTAVFSNVSLVTPRITGLNNTDALAAFYNRGLRVIVGDNSRNIYNPTTPHWMLNLPTSALAAGAAIKVIPRFATEVYFHCSTTAEDLDVYNFVYASQPNIPTSDWNVVLGRESQRVVRAMLLLRKDPHMFHQANMRVSTYPARTIATGVTGQYSLLMEWVEYIANQFTSLVSWPIRTLKMNDLYQYYLDREQRDNCGYNLFVNFNSTSSLISSVSLRTNTACKVPVASQTVFATTPANAVRERFGTIDPYTYWVTSPANGVTNFTYTAKIAWN